jgi:hypothetical protein
MDTIVNGDKWDDKHMTVALGHIEGVLFANRWTVQRVTILGSILSHGQHFKAGPHVEDLPIKEL